MSGKEATARIKINRLLEAAGSHFFADGSKPVNIRLESSVTIGSSELDALGDNFEKTSNSVVPIPRTSSNNQEAQNLWIFCVFCGQRGPVMP